MLSEQEVRGAVNFIKSPLCDDTPNQERLYEASQVLINLAQAYISAPAVEKKKCTCSDTLHQTAIDNFNNAVRLCKLEWVKKLAGIEDIIEKYIPKGQAFVSKREIAQAITEHFIKGE